MNWQAFTTYGKDFSEEEKYMFFDLLGLRIPDIDKNRLSYLDFPGGQISRSTYTRKMRGFKAKLTELFKD